MKLGFMGFFVKACTSRRCAMSRRSMPRSMATISSIAITTISESPSAPTAAWSFPVVRDADRLTFAEVERTIADFGRKARDGQRKIEDMRGGTFLDINGGVYGSLMSTPILNTAIGHPVRKSRSGR